MSTSSTQLPAPIGPGSVSGAPNLPNGFIDTFTSRYIDTGQVRLHALLGGLHLSGAYFTPTIGPTVHALTELAPDLLAPGHCTGWRAQHTLAAALPDSWVQSSSGTRYHLTAS